MTARDRRAVTIRRVAQRRRENVAYSVRFGELLFWPTRDDLDAVLDADRVDTLRQVAGGVPYDGLGSCSEAPIYRPGRDEGAPAPVAPRPWPYARRRHAPKPPAAPPPVSVTYAPPPRDPYAPPPPRVDLRPDEGRCGGFYMLIPHARKPVGYAAVVERGRLTLVPVYDE